MEWKVDASVGDLQKLWVEFSAEQDEKKKIELAQHFLFEYYKLERSQNNESLRFLSSVPSQLSCYLLQLVYDIICETVSSENSGESDGIDVLDDVGNSNASFLNCSPTTLTLKAPSDLTAIVSLREFLTNGLGRAILEYLHGCDTQLITSRRELGSLLINLFPSSSWDNTNAESFEPSVPMDFEKSIKRFNVINRNQATESCQDVIELLEEIDCDYTDLENFKNKRISSDQHAFIVIDILLKLAQNEWGQNLDEKSVTSESLQFAWDTLSTLQNSNPFDRSHLHLIKLKILALATNCLNNIFSKRKNLAVIDIKEISMKILETVNTNFEDELDLSEHQITATSITLYLSFGFLANVLATAGENRAELLANITEVLDENNRQLFLEHLTSIISRPKTDLSCSVDQIVDVILHTIRSCRANDSKDASTKRKQKIKSRKRQHSSQIHCKGTILSCILENALMKLFTLLDTRLQATIIQSFEKFSTCCCSFTIENIKLLMSCHHYSTELERQIYRFTRKGIICTLFSSENCNLCKSTATSPDFHKDLLELYIERYQAISKEQELINFLKHLLRVTSKISHRVSEGILTQIVLPVFHEEMQKDTRSSKNTQTILIFLKIFRNCLPNTQLTQIFFIEENISYLKDLIFVPDLAELVCALLNIGLMQSMGMELEEGNSNVLFDELNSLLLDANYHSSVMLNSVFRRLIGSENTFLKHPSSDHKLFGLLRDERINVQQLLHLATAYWDLCLEMSWLNSTFRAKFHESSALLEPAESENDKNPPKFFEFVCNVLCCFLSHGRKVQPQLTSSALGPETSVLDSTLAGNISITLTDYCFVTPEDILSSDAYTLQSTRSGLSGDVNVIQHSLSLSADGNGHRTPLASDCSSLNQSFEEVTNMMSSDDHMHNELVSRLKAYENEEIIFDIKNQSRASGVNKCCEKVFLSESDETKTEQKPGLVTGLFTINSLLTTGVNYLFGGPSTKSETVEEKCIGCGQGVCSSIDFISNDKLRCLQNTTSCKKKLLRMFTSSLATFVLGLNSAKDKSMLVLIRQLRNLLLPCSKQLWDDVDNANAIIQVLQALLRVAEMTGTYADGSSEQFISKYAKSSSDSSQDAPLSKVPHKTQLSNGSHDVSDDQDCGESDVELSDPDTEEVALSEDDKGYEADAEVLEISESSMDEKELFRKYSPSSQYRSHIINEGLCGLVVEILMELTVQCLKRPDCWVTSLTQLVKQLQAIRDTLGGSLSLLKGFSKVLSQNDCRLKDLQQSILELIDDLHDPDAFAAYLSILAAENPPIDILLQHMSNLCNNSIQATPYAALKFPVLNDGTISSFGNDRNDICMENIKYIRTLHDSNELDSVFTRSPCFLPISINTMKPFNEDGFTISTWIQITKNPNDIRRQKKCEETHIISFGTQQLIVSLYVNEECNLIVEFYHPTHDLSSKRGSISDRSPPTPTHHLSTSPNVSKNQERLCKLRSKRKLDPSENPKNATPQRERRSEGSSALRNVLQSTTLAIFNSFSNFNLLQNSVDHVLHGARIETDAMRLPENKWTHLCVSVLKQKKTLEVVIILDGTISIPFELPWNVPSSSTRRNFGLIAIGEMYPLDTNQLCSNHQYVNYNMTAVLAFKKSLSGRVLANLTALGPEYTNLIYCQAGNSIPNYGLLNYNVFSNFNLESLHEALKILRLNLVLSFSVYEPNYSIHYSNGESGPSTLENRQDVIRYTKIYPTQIRSLQNATYICGGLSCLLILFAKTVELTNKPEIQANALNILMRVALTDSRLYTEFIKKDTLNLIGSVIKTNQCSKSVHLLKIILNSACSSPVCVQEDGIIQLLDKIDVCIVYPNLLVNIIKRYSDWSIFEATESAVMDMLLQCIYNLVQEKQVHQVYNMSQFIKAGLVKELINMCKIYLVESPTPVYLSKTSAGLFVSILNIFAGAPPPPSLLDEIMKLLLILQKPNECYVTDNRSRFYFLLTAEIPTRQRRIGLRITSKQLRFTIRNRSKTLDASDGQFQSRGEMKLTKCEHLMSKRSNPARFGGTIDAIYDLETLQTIASCSGVTDRILCAVRREQNEKFRKFLLELKKKQIMQSQQQRNQMRKIVKRKSKFVKNTENGKTERVRKVSNSTEDLAAGVKDFDIVYSDEISSLEDAQSGNSKKFPRYAKLDVYQSVGVVSIQDGLFNLLRDFLLVLPDSSADEVLSHYVKLEIILVLANHRSCSIRASLLRLLMVICDRAPSSDLQVATKKMYWHHLANQLALHPVDSSLIETCIQWVTRKPNFSINSKDLLGLDMQIQNKFGLNSLFAMSAQTVYNCNLAANVFEVIEYIYRMNGAFQVYMIENGLIQCTVRSMQKIYLEVKSEYRKAETSIKNLLTTIAEKSLCSNGHMNILWDLLNILSYYGDSNFTKVVYGFRSIQAFVLLDLMNMFLRQNIHIGFSLNFREIELPGSNLSTSEIRTRFDMVMDRSVQFFISISNSYHPSDNEVKLYESLVTLGVSGNTRCSHLLAWGLCPERVLILKSSATNILLALLEKDHNLPTFSCDWKMVKAFLWKFQSLCGINGDSSPVSKVCRKLSVTENDLWSIDESLAKLELNRENCLAELRPVIEKAVYKFETCAQTCTDTAMSITRTVADLQNSERKHLMILMRQYDESLIYAEWKLVIQRMTHEGAPWYCSSQYPKSWELDDTEGPCRARARLRRTVLDIDSKYIMPDFQDAFTQNQPKTYPLKCLISSHDQQFNFSLNAQILFNFPAKYLPIEGEIDGELIVTDEKIFFAATHRYQFFYINSFIDNITEIWNRRYQHQENAFEFFINTNKSFFFIVENTEDRIMLREIFADKIVTTFDPSKLMQQWKDGRLTNWEYLMALNQLAGRTYNDLMQYPVFPWILADYKSDCLDLRQKNSFRKLERPIAVQHEASEQHYISNYSYMSNSMTNLGSWQMKPYHYSSHYSNTGTVLHFLVRVPPFTKFFIQYQDRNFDIPDRTFHSLNTTWSLASKDSPTDVKELIPEFFSFPEMFENLECFNFGVRQNGEIVNHVTLPPWCSNNPRLFILIHRQALESEMVRKNLHNWIDLIFGFKQTGQPAIDAINVFHPATYAEFDFENGADSIERQAFFTMVKTYGQMPKQLFKSPHDCSSELNYSPHQPSVLTSVKGLRWGIYTGSPQLEDPKICSVYKQINNPYTKLIPFEAKNIVYGLHDKSCIMLGTDAEFNLVSWQHDDFIVRIQAIDESIHTSKALLYDDPADPISCCGSHCTSNVLWFGHKSGKITVFHCTNHDIGKNNRNRSNHSGIKLSYNSAFRRISSKMSSRIEEYESLKDNRTCKLDLGTVHWSGPTTLIRHTDEVTEIRLSMEFKIVVSVARDGLAVVWDLNSLNYIRTIARPSEIRHSPLNIVAISPTLGDIFTVHSIESADLPSQETEEECFEVTEENDFVNVSMNFKGRSVMRLHSINGKYVSHNIQEERILSACYSFIKEGVGVNVIATGFEGGTVKLWSSWDLSLIRELMVSQSDIISITFSTYQHLAVLTKDYIQVWDSTGLLGDAPRFPQFILQKGVTV